jgi:hypothetical protein
MLVLALQINFLFSTCVDTQSPSTSKLKPTSSKSNLYLLLSIRIDNYIIDRIEQHEVEKSAKIFINKYFMEIKFPETNTSTIKNTKLVQIDLEKLFTKNYDYNRIINVDFNSTKFNTYVLYEIETMMSNLCENVSF